MCFTVFPSCDYVPAITTAPKIKDYKRAVSPHLRVFRGFSLRITRIQVTQINPAQIKYQTLLFLNTKQIKDKDSL